MIRLPGWGPPPLPLPPTVTDWRTPPSLNPVVIRPPQQRGEERFLERYFQTRYADYRSSVHRCSEAGAVATMLSDAATKRLWLVGDMMVPHEVNDLSGTQVP